MHSESNLSQMCHSTIFDILDIFFACSYDVEVICIGHNKSFSSAHVWGWPAICQHLIMRKSTTQHDLVLVNTLCYKHCPIPAHRHDFHLWIYELIFILACKDGAPLLEKSRPDRRQTEKRMQIWRQANRVKIILDVTLCVLHRPPPSCPAWAAQKYNLQTWQYPEGAWTAHWFGDNLKQA